MLKNGTILQDRYEILRLIGQGGMAAVYLARDTKLNRTLAVKEISKTGIWADDETRRSSLMAEARMLRQLTHPAIPTVYDIIDTPENIWVIMEYVDGTPLDRRLRDHGPETEETVLNWARQLADLLSFLHSKHILYLDMKPGNVLLCPGSRLMVVDFGTSRGGDMAAPAMNIGTRGYAAPEQYDGTPDPRTDIFALGMTLHQLLTGITPGNHYFPARHWKPEVSEALSAVIDKCVKPAPDQRYQNCQELLFDLNRCTAQTWKDAWYNEPLEIPAPSKKRENFLSRIAKHLTGMFQSPAKPADDPKSVLSLPISAALPPTGDLSTPTEPLRPTAEELTEAVDELYFERTSGLEPHIPALKYHIPKDSTQITWSKLQHLYILGKNNQDTHSALQRLGMRPGVYLDPSGTWMLLITGDTDLIQDALSSCCSSLEVLIVRYTNIETLSLDHLLRLQKLELSDNGRLRKISSLENLHDLQYLDISGTALEGTLSLSWADSLKSLYISHTSIQRIFTDHPLPHLLSFSAPYTGLTDADFLHHLPNLEWLDLSDCPIESIPEESLRQLTELECLNVSGTKLQSLPNLDSLNKLLILDCSYTPIRRIPDEIRSLTDLKYLYLEDLSLEALPDWLPEIASEFIVELNRAVPTDKAGSRRCEIHLTLTTVEGVDMSIFAQPYEMVVQWFQTQKEKRDANQESPLNEIKVVFLGDGEAGKSLTIARLMADGVSPEAFDGSATPGIDISHRTYQLDQRNVLVHFWDFGGQEIMHSMHRMFLTQRTLYVVMVNARDDTQDERARYWLHNIKSFADGAPVLLVVNKIDQNPNASINESGLRETYPALTETVRLSALNFSQEEFNNAFTAALKRQISSFAELESRFLPAWRRLKETLSAQTDHYIHGADFNSLCEQCGVEPNEKIRKALLKWFNDLGISFCYSESSRLEDYVILEPRWITNAIYVLLFNTISDQKNGMVSHDAIYKMLNPPAHLRESIRCVLPSAKYGPGDTEYVLNVIRRFRLSYLVQDGVEFFPMLCNKNDLPIAARYAADPDTLEFRMVYEYLPNNVIHRLMVNLHDDLDLNNVWLTGALFTKKSVGLSAVVRSDDRTLHIYVRSENIRKPAEFYLDIIKEAVERINASLGLQVKENQVIYKADGIAEPFDYEELLGNLEHGSNAIYSKRRKKMVAIDDILRQTDHGLDKDRQKLVDDLMLAFQKLQANEQNWETNENARNTYVRDLLRTAGYTAMDQSLSGISPGGCLPGELDMDIRKDPNIPLTIFEALNITGAGNSQIANWEKHLKKLMDNYNPNGLPFLVLAGYVQCKKEAFAEICVKYMEYICNSVHLGYSVTISESASSAPGYGPNQFIQRYSCIFDCNGYMSNVYIYFVRMGA